MPSTISSIGKGGAKNAPQARKHDASKQQPEKEASKQRNTTSLIGQVAKPATASTGAMPPILRYIPKSRRKEDESPFSECTSGNIETKATKDNGASITTLKGSAIVPTFKMCQAKVSKPLLLRFVISSKEGDDLLSARTKKGFDPNAHKLWRGLVMTFKIQLP